MAQILLYISALLHNVHVQSHPFRWTDQQCQPVFVHRFPNTSSCEPMATHLNTPFRDHLNWLRLTPLFALGPGNYLELVGVRCMLGMIPISNIGCHLRSGEWIMEILDKRQTLCHPRWYKWIRPRSTMGYSSPIIELWHALLLLSFLFLDNGTVGQITLVCDIVPSAELVRVNWSPMHVPTLHTIAVAIRRRTTPPPIFCLPVDVNRWLCIIRLFPVQLVLP